MPARGLLVRLQMMQADYRDLDLIQHIGYSRSIAFLKDTPEIEVAISILIGGTPIRMIWSSLKKGRGQGGEIKAEFFQGGNKVVRVIRMNCDPDVHIRGCTRVAMICNSIAADQDI